MVLPSHLPPREAAALLEALAAAYVVVAGDGAGAAYVVCTAADPFARVA